MRVLVCGGRNYSNKAHLFRVLDQIGPRVVIHGGASGADSLAREWAVSRGVDSFCYPALWDVHGRRAGPIRNQRMLVEGKPDLVVAFPGGRGTTDMVIRAMQAGVRVRQEVAS